MKKTVDKSELFWKACSRVFRVIPARCWKGTPLDHLIWRRINDSETPLLWHLTYFAALDVIINGMSRHSSSHILPVTLSLVSRGPFCADYNICTADCFVRCQKTGKRIWVFFRPVVAKITQIVARLWGLYFLTDKELTCFPQIKLFTDGKTGF